MAVTSRKHRNIFIGFSIAFGLLIGFVLCEVGFRIYLAYLFRGSLDSISTKTIADPNRSLRFADLIQADSSPKIVYRLRPSLRGYFARAEIETNSQGFRGPEHPPLKPKDAFRILGLGDSTMFGWGVGEGKCYMDILRESFADANAKGQPIQILNYAVPGYMAVQEISLFLEDGINYHPDVVVIQCDLNDAVPSPFILNPRFERLDTIYLGFLPDLLNGSLQEPEGKFIQSLQSNAKADVQSIGGWKRLTKAYEELAIACRENAISLYLLIPAVDEIDASAGIEVDSNYDRFRDIAQAHQIPVIECLPAIRVALQTTGQKSADIIIDPIRNRHPTELGHNLMAQILQERLVSDFGFSNVSSITLESAENQRIETEDFLLEWSGVHGKENWNGVEVCWSQPKGAIRVRRLGSTLWMRYFVAYPEISPKNPVTVRFLVPNAKPIEFTHTTGDFYENPIQLGPADRDEVQIEFEIIPSFQESPNGRILGVAMYPPSMSR